MFAPAPIFLPGIGFIKGFDYFSFYLFLLVELERRGGPPFSRVERTSSILVVDEELLNYFLLDDICTAFFIFYN
jgi:hypothetical protein